MSVNTFDPTAALVTVTDSAKAHFAKMLGNSQDKMIRLGTKVSGCSGYAYVLDAVTEKQANDLEITLDDGMVLLIAADAAPLVQDTEIDYVKVGINGEIRFNNPNVVSECGCGESFNVG